MQLVVNDETVIQLRDMSEEEFYEFCSLNEDYRIERTAQGDILIMPPAGGETGNRNMELGAQLQRWAKRDGRGVAFDSSTAFHLPDGAVLSPDASWVLRSRLARFTREQKRKFPPLCPDFVIELTSPSDRLSKVQEKMREWMDNGAELGWILHPDAQQVHIYRPGREVEVLRDAGQVSGEGPVEGFVLQLAEIWEVGW
jgi:Uma2 family endonuclease